MIQSEAEKQIVQILAELEKHTGRIVDFIEIEKIDSTGFRSENRSYKRFIRIRTLPLPGSDWDV